jgi:benzoyl-CoA reductase/2-hydroxyglutaryl-CoA dehydratase subunit BcrC/BadD/HgdB
VSVPDFPLDAAKSGTDTDTEDGIGLSPRFYSPRFSRQGVCPFLQAFMDDVCSTGILPVSFDAVILATTCDQMRRAGEMLSPPLAMPVFLMNVPVTWQSLTAAQMYQDELRRLGRFLVRIGGQTPSDAALTETMLAYQSARQDLLNRQEQMPARRFVELIFQLCQSNTAELCDADILSACDEGILPSCVAGVSPASSLSLAYSFSPFERQQDTHSNEIETAKETTARNGEDAGGTPATHADRMSASQRIPLAVVGGPMTARDLCVLDMIEQGGGRIVLNASESGQRCLPAAWGNRGQTPIPQTESVSVPNFPVPDFHDSPLATLAAAYFGAISDAFRRPDDLLYEYLRRELAARAVRGIVFVRQAWCDLWHAQAARMRAAFDLPLLDLDVSCPDSASANLSNRIQSFLEVLR